MPSYSLETHRSQSIVLVLANGPLTIEEINAEIPPHDLELTEMVIQDLLNAGLVKKTESGQRCYELTKEGQSILESLR